jgi:hypothetical protein
MANGSEIRLQLARLLAKQISLAEFSDWFVPYSWNIHREGNAVAQELASAIDDQLVEFEEDSIELRSALRNAAFSPATAATVERANLFVVENPIIIEASESRALGKIDIQPQQVRGHSPRRLGIRLSSTSPLLQVPAGR